MKYLVQGCESELRLRTLLGFTGITSEPIKQALCDHLQKDWRGMSKAGAARLNGVDEANFNRALRKLSKVAAEYEHLKLYEIKHLRSAK